MTLWNEFMSNDGKVIHKWPHFFPIYERHLNSWRNKTMTFIEIGVQNGGSLQMWQRYFGPMATIIGIDINPECKKHEGLNMHVRIGDQSDPEFLQSIIDEFGNPDCVLDDGCHKSDKQLSTMDILYPLIPINGCYIVEDTLFSYYKDFGGGLDNPDSFINRSKGYIDQMHARYNRGVLSPDIHTKETVSICYYPEVVVFEKGKIPFRNHFITGQIADQIYEDEEYLASYK